MNVGVKDRLAASDDHGVLYLGSEVVCQRCITDANLAAFIAQDGTAGVCDFCQRSGLLVPVLDLFIHMSECLQPELVPAHSSDEYPPSDMDLDVDFLTPSEILERYDHPLGNERLIEVFVDSFNDTWLPRHIMSDSFDEALRWSWEYFVDILKSSSRFVFLHPASEFLRDRELAPIEMLDQLGETIRNCDALIPYPAGQPIFRARKHNRDVYLTTEQELGAPPGSVVGGQRMNPPGISFFYGAQDEETALAEVRGLDGEVATVARWVTARESHIIDLARFKETPSIFDSENSRLRSEFKFVRQFSREIYKPLRSYDNPDVDYVPTQVIAEYFRYCLRSALGDPVAGLMYESAVMPGRTNVVFFPLEFRSKQLLRFDGPPVRYEATKVSTTWQPID